MSYLRTKVVDQAKAWLGYNESDGSHKKIIDVYNSHKPLARGYAVKYTDAWCATFVSAVAVKLGYTKIIPTECSCPKMITLLKNLGIWEESDSRVPKPGDIMFYDWDDNGVGDNKGEPEHVGIVEKVSGNVITIIEGNYKNAVTRRTLAVNGKYIRGYGVPKYDAETTTPTPATTTTPAKTESAYTLKQFIKDVQKACGAAVDGIAGPETISKTVTVSAKKNRTHPVVKAVQKRLAALGYTEVGTADGIAGPKFTSAVKHFQKDKGCYVDGEITAKNKTWKKLLGMA